MPEFSSTYSIQDYKTDVFSLPGITNYPYAAYLMTGTLVFKRSLVRVQRNQVNNLTLTQTFKTNFTDIPSEKYFKQAVIASIANFFFQFNSGLSSNHYSWSQISEFKYDLLFTLSIMGQLLWQFRNYKVEEFVTEMAVRLTTANSFWIQSMSNLDVPFVLEATVGKPQKFVVFGVSLLSGISLMILWGFLLIFMAIHSFVLAWRRSKNSNHSVEVVAQVNKLWRHPYFLVLTAMNQASDSNPEGIRVSFEMEDKATALKLVKK